VSNNGILSALVSKYYLGADYDLTLRDRVGFLVQDNILTRCCACSYFSLYAQVRTNWDVTTNYSYVNGSFVNLGLGTAVKWGAFQIYFIQDNVLLYMLPDRARSVYLRLGFNLVWGALPKRPRIN